MSHTLPGVGTDQSLYGEGRAGVERTNYNRRARAPPPGPAPEPAEVVRRPLHLSGLAPRPLSIAGRQVRSSLAQAGWRAAETGTGRVGSL